MHAEARNHSTDAIPELSVARDGGPISAHCETMLGYLHHDEQKLLPNGGHTSRHGNDGILSRAINMTIIIP